MKLPTPVGAIKFRMEMQELKQKDLIPYIGSASRVSEVLNEKRPLTLEMIRKLHEGLGISVEVLVGVEGATLPEPLLALIDQHAEEKKKERTDLIFESVVPR